METELTIENLNIEPSSSHKQPPGCADDSITLFKSNFMYKHTYVYIYTYTHVYIHTCTHEFCLR